MRSPFEDRELVLRELTERKSNLGSCPECGALRKCSQEGGKSSSTCWCMQMVPGVPSDLILYESCLCKTCLVEAVQT